METNTQEMRCSCSFIISLIIFFLSLTLATVISKQSADDKNDIETESVSVLKRGMAFGESEIMYNSLRSITVVSKTHIELLVVSKEDYAKIFFGADSESGKKEYISFLRTVDFLRDWPFDILESYPDQSQHCYFRRGAVIVRNSNISPWLYVVKSGVCEVLIRLNAVKPRKAIGRNVRELSSLEALTKMTLERRQEIRNRKNKKIEIHLPSISQKKGNSSLPGEKYRRKTLCYVPELDLVNNQTISKREAIQAAVNQPNIEDDFFPDCGNDDCESTPSSKSSITTSGSLSGRHLSKDLPNISKLNNALISTRRKSRAMSVVNSLCEVSNNFPRRTRAYSLPSTSISSELPKHSRTKSAFVQIDLLHPKRVFGLSELDFEYNALHPGQPANVSLVSRGAECIMISKKFFMEHANALTKRWIRLNVQPYLPTERHQQTLQEKVDWDTFKKKLVSTIVKEHPKTNLK